MVYPCCCECKCIKCATMALTGMAPTLVETWSTDLVDRTWNRSFTFWSRETTTRSPFDLFDDAGAVSACASELSDYPGTQCVLVADVCCIGDVGDDLPESPIPDDDAPPPPPPPPP